MVHFGGKNQQQQQPQQPRPPSAGSNSSGSEKDLTGNLELGELGQLTITNDNESSYDVSIYCNWKKFQGSIFLKMPAKMGRKGFEI